MIAILRRRPRGLFVLTKFVSDIYGRFFGRKPSPAPRPPAEPKGGRGAAAEAEQTDVDECCLVSLGTLIGMGSHDGLLSPNENEVSRLIPERVPCRPRSFDSRACGRGRRTADENSSLTT